jgi:phage-related minor tail protein
LQNYLDDTQNVYKSIGDVVGKAFKGMEDALVQFVKTGKLDFGSLADSIITDLIRIQIQQSVTQPLGAAVKDAGGLGGLFQAGKTLLGFAEGGDPPVGVPSMVGENGPELFVPKVAGTVVPNHMLGGPAHSSVVINQPLTLNANNASAETVAQIRRLMPNFMAENKRVIMSVVQQAMQKKAGRLTA